MKYDLIVRNGTVVDGTGYARRVADVAVSGGVVQKIGGLENARGAREIDASGLIVAPGVVDVHTHFDAQLHWDPYCTGSSWHGTTTVVMGNCGFGYAPCHVEDRDRVMRMMVNSEQVPYASQKAGIHWDWVTFPEWMDHLRRVPKGLNMGMLLPLNPLLVYVMGDGAGKRSATPAERQQMRNILNEAMDAGAAGFGFSHLGNGNGHVDHDGSPVPTDLMDPEEVYNLARVLRERGEGVIQSNVQLRQEVRREISENVARISGRPVIHNVIQIFDEPKGEYATPAAIALANRWRDTIAWVDQMQDEGLNIFLQSVSFRGFIEIKIEDSTLFMNIPVLEEFQLAPTREAKTALLGDPDFRQRARDAYRPELFMTIGGGPDRYILSSAKGSKKYAPHEGKRIGEIAALADSREIDILFDILLETDMDADFMLPDVSSFDAGKIVEMVRHPRVIAGTADGGAHVKMMAFNFWSTDMIKWLVRDEKRLTLEEIHNILSYRPARAFELKGRGAIMEGYAADLMIYDLAELGYRDRYVTVADLPGGEWRRTAPALGMKFVLVNGEVIMTDGQASGAFPGEVVTNHALSGAAASPAERTPVAAE